MAKFNNYSLDFDGASDYINCGNDSSLLGNSDLTVSAWVNISSFSGTYKGIALRGIFGTGYTGLLFASECKRAGKSGIHLGGATQILFGVIGNRWKAISEFQPLFNEHWTTPKQDETPRDVNCVEDACYWS